MSTLPGVGVFGTNQSARWIISKLQNQGFRVEAIWSNIFTDAESTANSLNIPFYTTRVDDVLLRKNVGFIIICTPPSLHSQIAVKALGIGKHVLCNIPGGLNQSECLRMVQAGQYYPSLMAVLSYSLRFHPAVVTMKEMISEGWIGESINLVDIRLSCGSLLDPEYSWMCDSGMGGGALARLGSHLIDLLTFLQLGRVTRVHANLKTLTRTTDNIRGIRFITAEDYAVVQMYLTGGCCVTICINSVLSGFSQDIIVSGSAGFLALSEDTLKGRKNGSNKETVFYSEDSRNDAAESSGLPKAHSVGMVNMIKELKEVFLSRSEESSPWCGAATFSEALYVQAVIEALRRSSETRQWRKVEMLDEDGGGVVM